MRRSLKNKIIEKLEENKKEIDSLFGELEENEKLNINKLSRFCELEGENRAMKWILEVEGEKYE